MKKQLRIGILLAAGTGSRMKQPVRKQYLQLCGKPLLYYSLKTMEESTVIDEIILVVEAQGEKRCRKEIIEKYGFQKVSKVIAGGKERQDSVWSALHEIERSYGRQEHLIFLQDAARPLLSHELLVSCEKEAKKKGACVAAVPVKDTVKRVGEDGVVLDTLKRQELWQAQTPQVFLQDCLTKAYRRIMEEKRSVTDDAMAVELMTDCKVAVVMGSYKNIKVTTSEDLLLAELFLNM